VYELPLIPVIISYIGIDMRAEVLGTSNRSSQLEYDIGELKKLPPLNDFIKKCCVQSLTDAQLSVRTKPLLHVPCRRKKKAKCLADFLQA
jgi:hypothetical protein